MLNVLKSLPFILFLGGLVILSIYFIKSYIKKCKLDIDYKEDIIRIIVSCVITVICIALLGKYTYPFERHLNPVLIAERSVSEEYELEYPGQRFWVGAYEKYGLRPASEYFDVTEKVSYLGFEWPDMDFDNHSYIITYGQKIESLSYNIWDNIVDPVRTGIKAGHMKLAKEFSPEKVYIYEIPKLRIENDINDNNRPWD